MTTINLSRSTKVEILCDFKLFLESQRNNESTKVEILCDFKRLVCD